MQLTRTNAVFSRVALVSSFCAEKSTFGKYPDFYLDQHNSPEDPRSRKGAAVATGVATEQKKADVESADVAQQT